MGNEWQKVEIRDRQLRAHIAMFWRGLETVFLWTVSVTESENKKLICLKMRKGMSSPC